MRIFLMFSFLILSIQAQAKSAGFMHLSVPQCQNQLRIIAATAKVRANSIKIPACKAYVMSGGDFTNGLGCRAAGGEASTRRLIEPSMRQAKRVCGVCGDSSSQKSCTEQIKNFSGGLNNVAKYIGNIKSGSNATIDELVIPEVIIPQVVSMCD